MNSKSLLLDSGSDTSDTNLLCHDFFCDLKMFVFCQDLPNNMIHQVPIKSLPQEWLWCETWCDDSSKKKAKTIDLVGGFTQ